MKKIELSAGRNYLRFYGHGDDDSATADPVRRVRIISRANRLTDDVVALPDFHYKVGNFIPTGTVLATDADRIVPCAVGNGSGCGYNLQSLPCREEDLQEQDVDRLFGELQQRIRIKQQGEVFPRDFSMRAFQEGLDAVEDCSDHDRARFDYQGNIYRGHDQAPARCDYQKFMPAKNFQRIYTDLEVLGGGNHFIELLSARRILNPAVAEHLGIARDQLFINFHADANAVGNMAETFTPYKTFRDWDRIRREFKKMRFHLGFYGHLEYYRRQDEIFSLPVTSRAGRRFLSFVFSSANYGAVNRYLLARKIAGIATRALGLDTPPAMVADNVHDLISFEEGRWIHRTGATRATRAIGATGTDQDPAAGADQVFARYGKPVMVPVALGGPTILGVPGPETGNTYHSLPHGAGRVIDRSAATGFSLADIGESMARNKVKLFRHGSFDITREHPDGFRKFENILEALTSNQLLDVVAILEPIAVLKA